MSETAEVPLSADPASCPQCEHDLTVHSENLGCWLCDCTFGRPAAERPAVKGARIARAWYRWVDDRGYPVESRGGKLISVSVNHAGRVLVRGEAIAEGVPLCHVVAAWLAERVALAANLAEKRRRLGGGTLVPLAAEGECPDPACGHLLAFHGVGLGCWDCACSSGREIQQQQGK